MLTKEHLRYKIISGRAIASYLGRNSKWLESCEELLNVYQQHLGKTSAELKDSLMKYTHCNSWESRVYRGLCQIIEKKLEYDDLDSEIFQNQRQEAFAYSKNLIQSSTDLSLQDVATKCQEYQNKLEFELYGDLPDQKKLSNVPEWSPEKFVQRYNLALAQSLFLYSDKVKIEILNISANETHYLLSKLKFFGLLFQQQQSKENNLTLNLEGPLSIIENSRRYRFQIASFLGILPQLKEYNCSAFLKLPEQQAWFSINNKDQLKSHYPPFFDYTPEEIELFINKANQSLQKLGYKSIRIELPQSPSHEWAAPDYSWESMAGRIHLEIFLSNQKKMLQRRLSKPVDKNTIFAIDKNLVELIQNHEILHFTFNKIPGVQAFIKVIKSLNS